MLRAPKSKAGLRLYPKVGKFPNLCDYNGLYRVIRSKEFAADFWSKVSLNLGVSSH